MLRMWRGALFAVCHAVAKYRVWRGELVGGGLLLLLLKWSHARALEVELFVQGCL